MFWSVQGGIQELNFQGCSSYIVKPRMCTLNIVSLESNLHTERVSSAKNKISGGLISEGNVSSQETQFNLKQTFYGTINILI